MECPTKRMWRTGTEVLFGLDSDPRRQAIRRYGTIANIYAFRLNNPIVFIELQEHPIILDYGTILVNLDVVNTTIQKRRLLHIDNIKALVYFADHLDNQAPKALKCVVHIVNAY